MKVISLASESLLLMVAVVAMFSRPVTCDCPNGQNSSTLLTYNLGLTTIVPSYDDRRDDVIDAIQNHGHHPDFMCLQELWYEKDVKNAIDKLEGDFPYHYSAIHSDVSQLRDDRETKSWNPFPGWHTVPCGKWELTMFTACFGWHCSNAVDGQQCVVNNCGDILFGTSEDCRNCISMASSGVSDVWATCADTSEMYNRINRPGLMVFSKQPLISTKYVNYHEGDKVLVERGYIEAQVQGRPTLVCTHLVAVYPYYYEVKLNQFKNYEEMMKSEIQTINNTFSGSPHVLLGDLNTGPGRNESSFPVVEAEVESKYDLLTRDIGYGNPYMDNDGRCTYCTSENPLLEAQKSVYGDLAIDHVLIYHGITSDVSSAKRVFDQPDVLLSDHYGVELDICLED